MAFLGTLWYQRGSPYSLQAHWAIVHSRSHVTLVACIPLLSTFFLWLRLGARSRSPVSLPLLLPTGRAARPVRDSSAIARLADALRPSPTERPSLFPPRCIVDIDRSMRAAAALAAHGRGRLLDAMAADRETAAVVVLPAWLRRWLWFLVPVILAMVRGRMRAKYPHVPTRDDLRAALRDVRAALAKSGTGYICTTGFTYADICVCSCMYFAVSRRAGTARDRIFSDRLLSEEFEDLVQWRAKVFKAHYPASERDAYNCVPPTHGR